MMLINVFGHWINPDKVTSLLYIPEIADNGAYTFIDGVEVRIIDKTPDEIASRINACYDGL